MSDLWECYEPEDYGYDDGANDECLHEDADIDLLIGRMSCRCGHTAWLSPAQYKRELQYQTEQMQAYYEECERDG
jgi:hypothetical protein